MARWVVAVMAGAVALTVGDGARAECPDAEPTPAHQMVRRAEDLPKPGEPALLWIGPESADGDRLALPSGALKRLALKPGSVLMALDLPKADLAGWKAPGVRIIQADLTGADLRRTDLADACFDHGTLVGAAFDQAKLRGARFDGADVTGAKFPDADLEGAVMLCAPGMVGEGCDGLGDGRLDLRRAKLRGADIAKPVEMYGADLTGAELDRTVLPLQAEALAAAKAAKVASVLLAPPALREGEPQLFAAEELTELLGLSAGDPVRLLLLEGETPSYACTSQLTAIERAVCDRPDLAALDRVMAATYKRALEHGPDKAAENAGQGAFLKQRNACLKGKAPDTDCVRQAYVARLAVLGRALREQAVAAFAKGQTLSAQPAALRPAVRERKFAPRLLRAFGGSPDLAVLRREGAGIGIDALAMGGNGHSCTFQGTVTFDAASGLWRDAQDPESMSWIIVPDALVNASTEAVARQSCGARATWPSAYLAPAGAP